MIVNNISQVPICHLKSKASIPKIARISLLVVCFLPSLGLSETLAKGVNKKSAGTLEEVIVTARRTSENMQTVPVAVSSLSSMALAEANIRNVGSLSNVVPGLDITEGRKEAGFSIRGVGKKSVTEVRIEGGVGVYLDGIYLPRNDNQLLELADVESVQVLRGPQGTLFGKNSIGGAILITTRKPAEELRGELELTVGDFGREDTRFSVDIPLVEDRLYSRFSIANTRFDGWAKDDNTGKEIGQEDRLTAAINLRFLNSKKLTTEFFAFWFKQSENISPTNCQFYNPVSLLANSRVPGRTEKYSEACAAVESYLYAGRVNTEDNGNIVSNENFLSSLNFTWEFESAQLKLLNSWNKVSDAQQGWDNDGTDFYQIGNQAEVLRDLERNNLVENPNQRYGTSHDLQLGGSLFNSRLNYTGGIFYAVESVDKNVGGAALSPSGYVGFEDTLPIGVVPGTTSTPIPPGILIVVNPKEYSLYSLDNTTEAAYGQASFDVTDWLQTTVGLRYVKEYRKYKQVRYIADVEALQVMTEIQFQQVENDRPGLVLKDSFKGELSYEQWSPTFSLTADLDSLFDLDNIDGLMAYITISDGFKSGGYNAAGSFVAKSFEPETLRNHEFGIKLDAFEKKMRMNLAFYSSDYNDLQLLVVERGEGINLIFVTKNAAQATIEGAELELTWMLNENWRFNINGAYTNAKYDEFDDLAIDPNTGDVRSFDRSSQSFYNIPRLSYSVSASYRTETAFGELSASFLGAWRDEIHIGIDFGASSNPAFEEFSNLDGRMIWNARLNFKPSAVTGLTLTMFGSNILDKKYIASGMSVADTIGGSNYIPGTPRSLGLTVAWEF